MWIAAAGTGGVGAVTVITRLRLHPPPPHRLARDRAGVVILTLIVLGLPARVWTVLAMPSGALYSTFPWWAQALLIVTLMVQLGVETWGRDHARCVAAMGSAGAFGMAAALFAYGDPTSGGVPTWAGAASMELAAVYLISRSIGRRG